MSCSFCFLPCTSFLHIAKDIGFLLRNPNERFHNYSRTGRRRNTYLVMSSQGNGNKSAKLVTFLGKGGSGKTTAAIISAQYYARTGFKTCLVIQSQDLTAEYLLGCKIGNSPCMCADNLSVVRLATTKMLLDPLDRLKKADARLNLTQDVLEGVMGEELGVLPGMDSIFSIITLGKLIRVLGGDLGDRNYSQEGFDVVIYDGISTEETLRMIGATERTRWYLKYLRSMAEKTDIGRLTAPSLLKLVDESVNFNGKSSVDGRTSAQIWNDYEQILEKISAAFSEASNFGCYLVMDHANSVSITSALRYWGCAIQAGAQITGAFGFSPRSTNIPEDVVKRISPLPFSSLPYLSVDDPIDWDKILKSLSEDAQKLFSLNCGYGSSVKFEVSTKSVTLFMPGFDKSEIKLFQYRGGTELLIEAGDQRRVIALPSGIQGKVRGAKFIDRNLVVTIR